MIVYATTYFFVSSKGKGTKMIVIVPANNKGGVGKTKVCALLAEYFSKFLQKKVLLIDLDPQCNLSQYFIEMEIDPAAPEGMIPPVNPFSDPESEEFKQNGGRSSIADIFFGGEVMPYETNIENLDILPGHAAKLDFAERVRKEDVAEKVVKHLSTFLNWPDVRDAYDVAIIDTAPSKGPLTRSAIKAATHLIIPSLMEEQPIQGVYGMLQLWMQESRSREKNKPLKLVGILPNMFKNILLHKQLLESLQNNEVMSKYVLPVKLGSRAAFAEVDVKCAHPKSIFDLPKSDPAKIEALNVCKYITQEVFGDVKATESV